MKTLTKTEAQMLATASTMGLTGGVRYDNREEWVACLNLAAEGYLVYTYECYAITPKGQELDSVLHGPKPLGLGILSSWVL